MPLNITKLLRCLNQDGSIVQKRDNSLQTSPVFHLFEKQSICTYAICSRNTEDFQNKIRQIEQAVSPRLSVDLVSYLTELNQDSIHLSHVNDLDPTFRIKYSGMPKHIVELLLNNGCDPANFTLTDENSSFGDGFFDALLRLFFVQWHVLDIAERSAYIKDFKAELVREFVSSKDKRNKFRIFASDDFDNILKTDKISPSLIAILQHIFGINIVLIDRQIIILQELYEQQDSPYLIFFKIGNVYRALQNRITPLNKSTTCPFWFRESNFLKHLLSGAQNQSKQ